MAVPRNRPMVEPILWPLILIGLALVAGGFYFSFQYDENHSLPIKLISVGLTELGFAFLIAAIVYFIFEATVKRKDAKDIAAFLYGIEVESTYFRMIEEYIIRCPFYRFNTVVTYRFKERHGESCLIDYVIEYDVKNVSRVKRKFKVEGEVETRPIHPGQGHKDWTLGVVGAEVTQKKKTAQPPLVLGTGKSSPYAQTYESKDFTLRPRECVHVKIAHMIEKHDHDSDVWQAAMPCSDVTLRIEWPEDWGLRFATEAIHPNSDDLAPDEGKDGTTCWKELVLKQPFMIRNGIHFSWSGKADGEPSSPEQAAPPVQSLL